MRALIITSRFPLPPWRGNQVRTVEWLRALDGWTRGLICPEPSKRTSATELADLAECVWMYPFSRAGSLMGVATAAATGRPAQEGLYESASARRVVAQAVQEVRPDVVVVQMVRCAWALEVLRSELPRVAVVFDAIDAMGLNFERAASHVAAPLKPLFLAEAARCRRREAEVASGAQLATAVCERDLKALSPPPDRGRVVPVSGRAIDRSCPDPARPTLLLSGNLGYRPTVAGAQWFADHVWPLLVDRVPDVRWLLVGARPKRAVRRLGELPGVELHADVPDMASYLARATVAIAPLTSGSGIPMKVLEAWSAAVPVVVDHWAAAGLDTEARTAVVSASEPREWLAALERLVRDPEAAATLGNRGHEMWASRYRFDRVAQAVRDVVVEASALAGSS